MPFSRAAGAPATDQIPGQIADPTPERANGGVRKTGPVSAGNVRRHTGREPAGRGVRAHIRVLGGVLARHTPARDARPQRTATVAQAD